MSYESLVTCQQVARDRVRKAIEEPLDECYLRPLPGEIKPATVDYNFYFSQKCIPFSSIYSFLLMFVSNLFASVDEEATLALYRQQQRQSNENWRFSCMADGHLLFLFFTESLSLTD